MKRLFILLFLINIPFYNGHAQKKSHHHKTARSGHSGKSIVKYGTASFYAKKFKGRQTSNGDTYNSTKLTAACNVLPLNTWIKVTNLRNKKSVIVIINDRMSAKNKRLVDLSKDAARQLGYISRGLTRVKVEVLANYQLSARP